MVRKLRQVQSIELDLGNDWPLIGRAAELERVGELYRRHGSGVVLVGAPGAGKTRLARECLRLAKSLGATAVDCIATRATSALPLGVFAPLLPVVHRGVASATDHTDLVLRCREELLDAHKGTGLGLLIDNAHLLDGASQALVELLAKSREVFLITTVDDDAAGTDFVVSLWKNSCLERVAVEPLADEWIDALASAVLGGPIDWATVRQLAEASEGKPLFLREFDTPAQGNKRPDGVVWCADNGAYSDKWEETKWWAWLVKNAPYAESCLFATAPDVVGDAEATIERSRPWLPKIRALGYKVAFAAQDGQENLPVPWDEFDVLFLGG
jgi:hypothetical protein